MPDKGYKTIRYDIASPNPAVANILLIYTGGTIGMGASESGKLAPYDFEKMLHHIPEINAFDLHITFISLTEPIDSSDIDPIHWNHIIEIVVNYEQQHDGIVILHGTDTMAYTASALSYALQGLNKPVVFTGAQLPITVPRTDARENLLTSLEIASAKHMGGKPVVPEVSIFFNHSLVRGNRAQKMESVKFNAFRSANYPLLAESGVSIRYNYSAIMPMGDRINDIKMPEWFRGVAVLPVFPGITKEAVLAVLDNPAIRGVVLETYGAGNAQTSEWFTSCIKKAVENEVLIYNVSQCVGGEVAQGLYATSAHLEEAGVVSGSDITIEAAITKLMFVLGSEKSYKSAINRMLRPICGELS